MFRNTKIVLLLLFLILILIIMLLLQSSNRSDVRKRPSIVETQQPTPPAILSIIETNITDQPLNVSEPITFKFNGQINPAGLQIKVTPEADLLVSTGQDPSVIQVIPKRSWGAAWDYDTNYSIIINSQGNQPLDQEYQYSFTTEKYID